MHAGNYRKVPDKGNNYIFFKLTRIPLYSVCIYIKPCIPYLCTIDSFNKIGGGYTVIASRLWINLILDLTNTRSE